MLSIIIVNYHVRKELFECIKSIFDSRSKTPFEIIVVDNDEIKTLEKNIKKKFPKVRYLPNLNKGFGQGNNAGAKIAKGEYLFFLNPDTKVYSRTIDSLVEFLKENKKVGIVAPLLYDKNNQLYPQGARELTPLSAVFTFSFIHKFIPNNPIAKKYWFSNEWDKKNPKEVESIPGTAFVIRRKIYERLKGFDEKFFMYFEEHDLCKRIRSLGWKIVMHPKAKIYHALGRSSRQVKDINRVFIQSRFYYLRKHFGLLNAVWAESILRFSKYTAMLLGILGLSLSLMTYRLSELMSFIGDQGWFYLSARDLVIHGSIPLVGIASSHPWIHQGAWWTYMLASVLTAFSFDPLGGAYLSITLTLITVIMLYYLASIMFSRQVGIIAAFFYATSPLIIMSARMPYHTSPIPLCTLIYIWALFRWIQGKPSYFPVIIFILAFLYNFQIATFLLTIVLVLICGYGLLKKKKWFLQILNTKILSFSFIAFLIPMLPMLIYDIGHGFPQTVLFIAWIGYKIATLFGYPSLNPEVSSPSLKSVAMFMADYYIKLIYIAGNLVAFTIALCSFGFFLKDIFYRIKHREHDISYYLVGLILLIGISGILGTRTISEAYLPIVYPTLILITALFFNKLIHIRPKLTPLVVCIIGLIGFMNIATLLTNNYFISKGGGLADKIKSVREIITIADGKDYNMIGRGQGSQFESFTMNYEYLAWWLGHAPSKNKQELRFVIEETVNGIRVKKEIHE